MANLDGFVLNGVNINDETNYGLEALDLTPPAKKIEESQGSDSDGGYLIRTPLYENRKILMTFRIGKQASQDAALEKLGALVDLWQEAEKNPEGIPLEYTPSKSTKKITFYVLTGWITEIPMVVEGNDAGFYVEMPKIKAVMTAKPFGYGAEKEVLAAKTIETGLSIVTGTVANLEGDVPAEGRLVVKDTAGKGRRFVEWGLQNRYYDAATSLWQAAEALTAVGGALSEAANTGAYKPGAGTKLTVATTLFPEPTICAETGVLKHIGGFRVKARVQAVLGAESLAEKVKLRLSYQDGEGPFRANAWQAPVLGGKYVEVDLGTVSLTEKLTGTQKWVGRVEAYSTDAAGKDVLHINYLTFIPTELYGKARGVQSLAPGTIVAYDNFTSGTLSGSLNTRTPAQGAAWATSGAATDWTVAEGEATRHAKSDAEPRYSVLGSASGNSRVVLKGNVEKKAAAGEKLVGAIIRWTNATNYAFLIANVRTTGKHTIQLGVVVAGVTTVLQEAAVAGGGASTNIEYAITLSATLDGALAASGTFEGQSFSLAASHKSIMTGEALASGKVGVYAWNKTVTETFWRFQSITGTSLPAVPFCVQSERSMEARSESTITADSTGTYFGPVPQYRGARFYMPQGGSAKRTTRVIVKADRNDLEAADQQTIADAFTVAIFATPRFSAIPR